MRRLTWILLISVALLAAGCGDDEDEGGGGGGGGGSLTLTADPGGEVSWEPADLSASAGSVTITLVNESDNPHAVQIEGQGEPSETITGSETDLTVDLEAGEYTFFCPVGQHRQNGMEGTLTVE
jgi:plastocyanin